MNTDLPQREFNPHKILHEIERLKALAEGKDVVPVTVEIDPVAYCNHACAWCVDPVHRPITMPEATYDCLVKELASFRVNGFRVKGIVLKGGGEPTLHPAFGHLVEQTHDAGFAIGVVTNGSRLMRWAEVLAQHASYVRISLDGPTPALHHQIHQSHDFEEIVAGVERLIELRHDQRYPIIGLSFAMDIDTVGAAREAIALGDRLGVDYVLLRPPFFEEVGRTATMSIDQARLVRQRLRDAAAAYQGLMLVQVGNWIGDAEQQQIAEQHRLADAGRRDQQLTTTLPIEHRTGRCLASPVLAVVTADGSVYGCCNLRAIEPWSFGKIDYGRGVTFAAIWHGEQRRSVLSQMHRTACIRHCTHPLSRYNEIIELLRDEEQPHSQFV